MRVFLTFCLLIFGFVGVSAQRERFVKPVDEAKKDASFLAFRTKLMAAAKRRDAKYILSILDKNIMNSFGGGGGIGEFKETWKIETPESEFWNEFLPVISNGGLFLNEENNGKTFFAPYTFRRFPEDLDAFTYSVIFGSSVNLRDKPDAKAAIVGKLSYNIVEITRRIENKTDSEKVDWYEIKTLGGKTGFVKAEFVRSPIDYRAGFEKKNGSWKMVYFIAGD